MTAAVPASVLAALGALNSHARSPRAGSQRDAIYAYKTAAALQLVAGGQAAVRFVRWTGTCNRCTNGWFIHWDWDDGHKVRCRDCGGTAKRTLRFTETTLPDGQVWHHPWHTGNGKGYDIARAAVPDLAFVDGDYRDGTDVPVAWHEPGEWKPNLPGRHLEVDELAALLNTVEDWIEAAFPPDVDGWLFRHAKHHMQQWTYPGVTGAPSHSYQLDLGRAPGGCFVCGTTDDLYGGYGRMTPLLHWSLPVCRTHGYGPAKVPFPDGPPPETLLTPAIRQWLARHEHVMEAAR